MKNFKSKLIFLLIALIVMLGLTKIEVYATNENIKIVEKLDGRYLIYIKDYLSTNFEFQFSNDPNEDRTILTYITAATDGEANEVAFVDSSTIGMFSNATYIWARIGSNPNYTYILDGVEVELTLAIHEDDLNLGSSLTKLIDVDLTQTTSTTETIDGKEVRVEIGKIVLLDESTTYEYEMMKVPATGLYKDLMDLAERIAKFNHNTDMYTKIEVYSLFYDLYNNLIGTLGNWQEVERI